MKLKKDGTPKLSGGSGRNQGAKPKSGKFVQFRPSVEVAQILEKQKNKTAYIECAILAYNVRDFEKGVEEVVFI